MGRIKKAFLYAGLEEEQYEKLFSELLKVNIKNLCIYSLGMSIYFSVYFVYAIVFTGFHPLYLFYLADIVAMTTFYLGVRFISKRQNVKPKVQILMNYLFMSIIYLDAMVITCAFPDRQSTAFYVRIVLLPVLCMDTPIRMILFQVASVLVFYIITPMYNLPEIVEMDISEIVSYVIISFVIGIFITSIRVKDILHSKDNEFLSYYDVLTGVKNRNCFEDEHVKKDLVKDVDRYYIYADVNELHEINNNQGHEAGDALLRTVTDGLKSYFGVNESYRLGGDEFVSFTDNMSKAEIDKVIDNLMKEFAKFGYHVSFGVAGVNENFDSVEELLKAAEQRMYVEKKRYYEEKGKVFGSRERKY